MAVTKLPGDVVDIQLKERTDLTNSRIGPAQRDTILQAGLALQKAGVIAAECRREEGARRSVDDRFVTAALSAHVRGVPARIAFARCQPCLLSA